MSWRPCWACDGQGELTQGRYEVMCVECDGAGWFAPARVERCEEDREDVDF